MRVRTAASLAVLLLAGGSAVAEEGGKIKWGFDHDKALAEAKVSGKPILMYFTASW